MNVTGTVDISGIPKAKLLAALYNAARPIGFGVLEAHIASREGLSVMSEQHAQSLIDAYYLDSCTRLYFDYVYGRPLKVDISDATMETGLYDRDQGEGQAWRVVLQLRQEHPKTQTGAEHG